jgi:hypothetical protein
LVVKRGSESFVGQPEATFGNRIALSALTQVLLPGNLWNLEEL